MTSTAAPARRPLSADTRRVLAAQALRAAAYGLGAVLLGTTLDTLGFSPVEAGIVLAAVVGGAVTGSWVIGRRGDQWGRRRSYAILYLLLAATAVVFAFAEQWWVLALVALAGAMSTEVVESGPFTSIEQAMLASDLRGHELARGFSIYNAVAAAAGSLGALAAGLPALARRAWAGAPVDQRWFLVIVPIAVTGAVVARSLSNAVEPPVDAEVSTGGRALGESRPVVLRLAGLFAVDSFAGGFTVTAFIAYWFAQRFGTSAATLGLVFAAAGVLQTLSFLAAGRLGERFGLLQTMVGTHLPSNLLLASLAFAPTFPVALVLLYARVGLSQMDVPTRQAYVMALVPPGERTAAAATTNSARYLTRPFGTALGGVAASTIALGAPFVIAGSIKSAYDLVLWRWFRTVPLPQETTA